jgi:tyrosine-protein phosphatase SIW14
VVHQERVSVILQVDSNVYRSNRPDAAELVSIKAKFQCVISLEGFAEDAKEANELSPVRLLSRPISFQQIYFTGISQLVLGNLLQLIAASPKPLLVHCEHGEDRTGLVIAAYRVRQWKWTKEAAMAEALRLGYRRWLNFGLNKTWSAFS